MEQQIVETQGRLSNVVGPIRLPLDCKGEVHYFHLTYFEANGERWAAAVLDDGGAEAGRMPLRIELACFFGHVMGSRQCDCGFQLQEAFRRIGELGRGMVIYAIDQDARGLGIVNHFKIYRYRQAEGLDTPEVFERLDAELDNRDYSPVADILRHLGVESILLLSNNRGRLDFLRSHGFDAVREELEAPLDRFNMATLMLEKEDLGYQWTFRTHGDWLKLVQDEVDGDIDKRAGLVVRGNKETVARWSGSDWSVAGNLVRDLPSDPGHIVYLSDLPRLDEIDAYADIGAQFVVVPFARIPEALAARAASRKIKLQDWGRENAYRSERPQWLPVEGEGEAGGYRRGDETRSVAD